MAVTAVTEMPPARLLERAYYRVSQFVRGWRAAVSAQDRALVQSLLPARALKLFERMPVDAQAHSLRVLKLLQSSGRTSSDLAVAALLHDAGKVAANDAGAYLGLWLRGPIVLLEAVRPAWLAAWASPVPAPGVRYALFVQIEHPQIGAQWAAEAGCSAGACWLIAHHQDDPAQVEALERLPLENSKQAAQLQNDLARLQWADGRN